jgi:sulfite oxidase
LWYMTVKARPGPITVTARAWDDTGVTQPESPAPLWNPRGHGNNAWARVELTIV